MLRINFPLESKVLSAFPDSTPYMLILPEWHPDITCLLSGENATVHTSNGPASIFFVKVPSSTFHNLIVESNELLTITEIYKKEKHYLKKKS